MFVDLSIRAYLVLLIAAVLVPMLVLAGVLAWHYADAERRIIEAQRVDVANNLGHLIDRDIESMAGFLSGVALSPRLQAADPEIVRRVASLGHQRGFESLGLFDRNGTLLVSMPGGGVPFAAADAVGVGIVLAGQPMFVSNLQRAADGKAGPYYISVPILRDGEPIGVLSGGVSVRHLQKLFGEAGLRESWRAGIVDRQGTILASSRDAETLIGVRAQDPLVVAVHSGRANGLFDLVSRDGVRMSNSFQRSTISGWTAAVAVPAAVIEEPFRNTALVLGMAALLLTLIGLLQAVVVASAIAGAVRQLGAAVVAFASRREVILPRWTMRELRDVLRVVESTAAMGWPKVGKDERDRDERDRGGRDRDGRDRDGR
ncbi:MAG: cache domain-containing protein [Proteobacteria bacterium]|nr:cache domain-containing protein [Pseudomonadota bacterium]